MGSAADYVRFVTEMCVPSTAVSSFTSAPSLLSLRQHDLCHLGPRITFEQFSKKMFEIITANQFYDHHHWSPGPLGHRDPVFQNIMFAPWSMVRLFAFALPPATRRPFTVTAPCSRTETGHIILHLFTL